MLTGLARPDRVTASAFSPHTGPAHTAIPVPFDIHLGDLVTVGLLVVLEGLLSADNALVMAVMILGLPRAEQGKALRYGLVGAFGFRTVATVLATWLIRLVWVKLLGGVYLLYLTVAHFRSRRQSDQPHGAPPARPGFGLPAFWATVIRVELMNLAFSIDSILVAVAMSPKFWVVLSGGLLGIVAMRVVVGQLLELIRRYPALVDGAFAIIAWVALKLLIEYAHQMAWLGWAIPQSVSLGLIGIIFIVSYVLARRGGPHDAPADPKGSPGA
jgi:YkoY family integral membrane protein